MDLSSLVMPGELTLVTGVPNSGKSEWIDALLCNLNESVGWKFALCSMENNVQQHARKLLEKHLKKPFFDAHYGEYAERMSAEELEVGKQWLSDTFYLIRCEDDALPNIKWLDHQRLANMTETEYESNAGPIDQVQVLVRKVRNKVVGTIGDAFLSYNRVTGEFMNVDNSAGSDNQGLKPHGS
ncbi:hypothetical protein OIU78_017489 [Salix suchowensis]|nr:hypothetical protein OIU78_017489 [Salix suchowensis]